MIEVLHDLPDNVIGLEAKGKVTSSDYADVIGPAIDAKQREFDKVRLMYVLGPGFEGYTPGAMWDDSKLIFKRPGSWERIAVVTDEEWVRRSIALFGWMSPGEVKVFDYGEEALAREWVSE
jgi:stage II sporulation SpoAA-like protein